MISCVIATIVLDGAERRAEAVKAGNSVLIRAERIHACTVGRQCARTAVRALYAEQNLVRAVRITADVLVFGIADPAAVNILTDLIERILIGLCQLFALEVVECVITGRFCGDVGIAVLTYIQRMRAGCNALAALR